MTIKITIWTLESDYDAGAVKCLASKLIKYFEITNIAIRSVGKSAIPRPKKGSPGSILTDCVKNYLKQDDFVIFVIDKDGVMASSQRETEPNSLSNQVKEVLRNKTFSNRVYSISAIQELEAWLLIDCMGIFCFFAEKKRKYKENCREETTSNANLEKFIKKHQLGDTALIVEAEAGGRGVKEYLTRFSEKILRKLNPNMKPENLKQERYREALSPQIAEYLSLD